MPLVTMKSQLSVKAGINNSQIKDRHNDPKSITSHIPGHTGLDTSGNPQTFTVKNYVVTGEQTFDRTEGLEEYYNRAFQIGDSLSARKTGFGSPYILRKVGDRWGLNPFEPGPDAGSNLLKGIVSKLDGFSSGFIRGGISTALDRSVADITRTGKFLISPNGISFLAKQFILQSFNSTVESRLYNPLSLGSIIPMLRLHRHFGAAKYSDIVPNLNLNDIILNNLPGPIKTAVQPALKLFGSDVSKKSGEGEGRIAWQVKSLFEPSPISAKLAVGLSTATRAISGKISSFSGKVSNATSKLKLDKQSTAIFDSVASTISSITLPGFEVPNAFNLILSNPNKYIPNPLSLSKYGISSIDIDVNEIRNKRGGTFNSKESYSSTNVEKLKQYAMLSYGELNKANSYGTTLKSAGEIRDNSDISNIKQSLRQKGKLKIYYTGESNTVDEIENYSGEFNEILKVGDPIKFKTNAADKINLIPYGKYGLIGSKFGTAISEEDDFIRFKIKDITNDKNLVFRALLSGISDTVTAEWNETKYIGRPDKAYSYSGVGRQISLTLQVYPKTMQELPVLWDKMNFLVGLCYPNWLDIDEIGGKAMVAPFIELTLGNMFRNTPGFFNSVGITVSDDTTWELSKDFQLPKHLDIALDFTYVGQYMPNATGKHYELGWLRDSLGDGSGTLDSSTKPFSERKVNRSLGSIENGINMSELFNQLEAKN